MLTANFAIRYRPKRFEDVVGQEYPVRALSGLIKRKSAYSVLLHGSIGSGKTTLARIYSAALNCTSPRLDSGSPCGLCQRCKSKAGHYEYDTSREGGDAGSIAHFVNRYAKTPDVEANSCSVLFFDEAHNLTKDGADFLLKSIEDAAERVIFCFATTELESMRPALVSRLLLLEVKPLPTDDAVEFLADKAKDLCLEYDREALHLLAGLKRGYPRDLLMGLEQVSEIMGEGRVTVERVQAAFGIDHTTHLVRYFMALARGDITEQTKVLSDWRDPTLDKVRWTQLLLTSLYYNHIIGRPVTVDPISQSISSWESAQIIATFCKRLGADRQRDLAPFWRDLMACWPLIAQDKGTIDQIEAVMALRLALFHHRVNAVPPPTVRPADIAITTRKPAPAGLRLPKDVRLFGLAPSTPKPRIREDERRLPAETVREIMNRSSFLVQEYGVLFNAKIVVRASRLTAMAWESETARVSEFLRHLRTRTEAWGGGEKFAYLAVFERHVDGVHGIIATHLPVDTNIDCLSKAEEWAPRWPATQGAGAQLNEAITLERAPTGIKGALQFHRAVTLRLCAGLNPDECAWDPKKQSWRLLVELLGIKPSKSAEVSNDCERNFGASKLLSEKAIRKACDLRMPPLSAFDANAWPWLRTDWELKEHYDRRAERDRRQAQIRDAADVYGVGTTNEQAAIEAIMAGWPKDPEDHDRSWEVWWAPVEL